jgi:hypothetical protein
VTQRFEGLVVKKRIAVGSKSERDAVVLETRDAELVLRRKGGNAFSDPVLDQLVGTRISGEGRRTGYTLILDEWRPLSRK